MIWGQILLSDYTEVLVGLKAILLLQGKIEAILICVFAAWLLLPSLCNASKPHCFISFNKCRISLYNASKGLLHPWKKINSTDKKTVFLSDATCNSKIFDICFMLLFKFCSLGNAIGDVIGGILLNGTCFFQIAFSAVMKWKSNFKCIILNSVNCRNASA